MFIRLKDSTLINVYDVAAKTLTPGTIADIEKGCSFAARLTYYQANEILVYINEDK